MFESDYADDLPPEVAATGWLGLPGASEEQIVAAEARLGATLSAIYGAFLKASNGWRFGNGFAVSTNGASQRGLTIKQWLIYCSKVYRRLL